MSIYIYILYMSNFNLHRWYIYKLSYLKNLSSLLWRPNHLNILHNPPFFNTLILKPAPAKKISYPFHPTTFMEFFFPLLFVSPIFFVVFCGSPQKNGHPLFFQVVSDQQRLDLGHMHQSIRLFATLQGHRDKGTKGCCARHHALKPLLGAWLAKSGAWYF